MRRQMLKSKNHRVTVQLNGAAARLVREGDKVIIVSYGDYDYRDLETHSPIVVHVDDRNRTVGIDSNPEVLLTGSEGTGEFDEIPGSLGPGTATVGGLS